MQHGSICRSLLLSSTNQIKSSSCMNAHHKFTTRWQMSSSKPTNLMATGYGHNYGRRTIMTQTVCCKNAFSSASRTFYQGPINDDAAKRIVKKLSKAERLLISQELQRYEREKRENGNGDPPSLTSNQVKALFAINCTPFVGFGFFDNFIMILAGEYIDNTLGVMLGISTMAAAALGNLISDLAGVQLSLYIEAWCSKFGLYPPDLTPEQSELPKTNRIIAAGKLIGITVGCLIGMFPLLFINNDDDEKEDKDEAVTEEEGL